MPLFQGTGSFVFPAQQQVTYHADGTRTFSEPVPFEHEVAAARAQLRAAAAPEAVEDTVMREAAASEDILSEELNVPPLPGQGFFASSQPRPQIPVEAFFGSPIVETQPFEIQLPEQEERREHPEGLVQAEVQGHEELQDDADHDGVIHACPAGELVQCKVYNITNSSPDPLLPPEFEMTKVGKSKTWTRTWFVMKKSSWPSSSSADHVRSGIDFLSEHFQVQHKGLWGIAEMDDGSFYIIINKTPTERRNGAPYNALEPLEYYTLSTPRGAWNQRGFITKFLKCFMKMGVRFTGNFAVNAVAADVAEDSIQSVVEFFSTLEPEEIQTEIMRAKKIPKKERNERESVIVSCSAELRAIKKIRSDKNVTNSSTTRFADDQSIPEYRKLTALHAHTCFTMDVETGAMITVTVDQCMRSGMFLEYSLVMLGSAGLGKTPAAESIMKVLANYFPREHDRAFFVKVGTSDALRKCGPLLKEGIPILLDDVTPSNARGTRGAMPIDEIKHLTNVRSAEVVDARNSDIVLFAQQPRIFTSNAQSPREWHSCMINIKAFRTDAERLQACSFDCRALYKRCIFLEVTEALIEQSERHYFRESKTQVAMRRIATLLDQ